MELSASTITEKILLASQKLLENSSEAMDYQYLTDTISEISGAKFGFFNFFSDDNKTFRNTAIYGLHKHLQTGYKLL